MTENRQKKWTDELDDFLYEHGATRNLPWIAKQLGRTEEGVQRRLERLGIANKHIMTGTYSANELASMLGVDSKTVINWIKERGLYAQQGSYFKETSQRKKIKTKENRHKPWFIMSTDFWKWAEENKQRINFSRFDHHTFPDEPEWVNKERKKHIKMPKTKTLWSKEEDDLAWRLYYQGYTQKEISERLSRSVAAVERRLKRLREQRLPKMGENK